MAIVLSPTDHITPKGIITLEDVMEELLQQDILDEDDLRREEAEVIRDVRLAKAFLPRKSIAPVVTPRKSSTANSTNPPPPPPYQSVTILPPPPPAAMYKHIRSISNTNYPTLASTRRTPTSQSTNNITNMATTPNNSNPPPNNEQTPLLHSGKGSG